MSGTVGCDVELSNRGHTNERDHREWLHEIGCTDQDQDQEQDRSTKEMRRTRGISNGVIERTFGNRG